MKLKDKTLYVLARDVENPKPDRRTAERKVFAQPVLKKGLVLRAESHTRRSKGEIEALPVEIRGKVAASNIYWTLEPASASFYGGHGNISAHHSPQASDRNGDPKGPTLWELLMADGVLEEMAPKDADDVVRAFGKRTHDAGMLICAAIDVLVADGKITLEDFAAAMARQGEGGKAEVS